MVVVSVAIARYEISVSYLSSLAGEFCGRVLSGHDKGENRMIEVGFEDPQASTHSKDFRKILDASFKKPLSGDGEGV